ncbi:protein translocase subunit SecD [Streptomyces beihaiensis]|uniref:Protein translocase subunit SecD n=1 Tax=Streptomyces beihaiensis TaxID=2984495 RepID=A0ABT3U2Q3_9ACTN|nr:protein translocase subunit SecD [Streptomyces beihaiensis]MCX3062545.1 protein translocase subunit SecD [Streptomyces beihaiensis]
MAAPRRSRGAGAQSKPGRALALIAIIVVALVAGMFGAKSFTPRLGIDLAGGTSITLAAQNEPGKPNAINKTNMNTAADIIERRVNGMGVSESEVQTQGNRNIIVNIPRGTNEKQAREQVGTTAQLYFRPVLTVAAGAPSGKSTASPSPSASSSGKAGGKATDKASSSAKPSTTASPTSQGRAVTDALKADAKPSASASGGGKASPSTSPTPSASSSAGSAQTSALEKKFTDLDCTDQAARTRVNEGTKPTDTIVACGKNSQGQWEKYILGPSEVNGKDVKKAQAVINQQSGQWVVNMDFTGSGSKKFAATTTKLKSQQDPMNRFAIVLDGDVVSAPSVSETLSANAEISGSFTQQSAQDLANVLSYGALPLTFHEQSVTSVTPELGGEQLDAGLIAGAIGLALVIIYLVVYYRGLSLIAIASLLTSAVLTYTIMTLLGPAIGFALNLPAVSGAIVAIGITADSFIVFFERIRDEIREGRSVQPAVARAWPRARRTILVSDFVSFLAAAVLYVVTVGKVQGFAFTLGLTTVLDVVVVFLFTKPLMTILARKKFFTSGHKWSGLDPKRLGAKPPLRRSRRASTPAAGPVDPKEA